MAKQQNKYLTFLLDDEVYGIPILKVKEIIGMLNIIHLPKVPEYVKGVINLRGKIIPIIDLRLKFGLQNRDYDDRTCIIVVEIETSHGGRLHGLVVDIVSEVQDIPPESVEETPIYNSSIEETFLTGMGKVKEKVIMLIDADKIFDHNDTINIDISEKNHTSDLNTEEVKEKTFA